MLGSLYCNDASWDLNSGEMTGHLGKYGETGIEKGGSRKLKCWEESSNLIMIPNLIAILPKTEQIEKQNIYLSHRVGRNSMKRHWLDCLGNTLAL